MSCLIQTLTSSLTNCFHVFLSLARCNTSDTQLPEPVMSSEKILRDFQRSVFERARPTEVEKALSKSVIEKQNEHVKAVAKELSEALESMNGHFILTDQGQESDLNMLPFVFNTFEERQHYEVTFNRDNIQRYSDDQESFLTKVKQDLANELQLDQDSIFFHGKIVGGSVKLSLPSGTKDSSSYLPAIIKCFCCGDEAKQVDCIGPVLRLDVEDFDSRGDAKYFHSGNFTRGKLTYKQPSKEWKRVGLSVLGKYDNGNDDWLMMDGREGEWAIGFHGCRTLAGTESIAHNRTIETDGPGQAYSGDTDVNKWGDNFGKKCGKGAYFAQDIETSAGTYAAKETVEGKKTAIVFQVRVNPKRVRIPESQDDYLIAPSVDDARPYGICLKKV